VALHNAGPKMTIEVRPNYKFAVLAVPETRGRHAAATLVRLSPEYAVSTALPHKALESWRDDIGRFREEQLQTCSLFLWAFHESRNPDVLDEENEVLSDEVYRLYLGLMLAVPYFSGGPLTLLTGSNADGTARVRSMSSFDRSHHTLGAPEADISMPRLRTAARLAAAFRAHESLPGSERMERSFRAFREASESPYIDTRLHQFVRAAETLVAPPDGATFTNRLARVCAGNSRPALKEIYTLRSAIEHLHGPYERMPASLSKRQRRWRLLMRTLQIEALSRYMLVNYLTTPELWPQFSTLRGVKLFWTQPNRELKKHWPSRLGLTHLLRDFDVAAVQRAEDANAPWR